MREEPKDKYHGISMSEWISRVPNELDRDAVGLWQIVPVGRDSFSLAGNDLVDFVRRCLLELFARGARPVEANDVGINDWKLKEEYGTTPEEMADSIIHEWKESGRDPSPVNSIWFMLPEKI
jgi:hypothetical protein